MKEAEDAKQVHYPVRLPSAQLRERNSPTDERLPEGRETSPVKVQSSLGIQRKNGSSQQQKEAKRCEDTFVKGEISSKRLSEGTTRSTEKANSLLLADPGLDLEREIQSALEAAGLPQLGEGKMSDFRSDRETPTTPRKAKQGLELSPANNKRMRPVSPSSQASEQHASLQAMKEGGEPCHTEGVAELQTTVRALAAEELKSLTKDLLSHHNLDSERGSTPVRTLGPEVAKLNSGKANTDAAAQKQALPTDGLAAWDTPESKKQTPSKHVSLQPPAARSSRVTGNNITQKSTSLASRRPNVSHSAGTKQNATLNSRRTSVAPRNRRGSVAIASNQGDVVNASQRRNNVTSNAIQRRGNTVNTSSHQQTWGVAANRRTGAARTGLGSGKTGVSPSNRTGQTGTKQGAAASQVAAKQQIGRGVRTGYGKRPGVQSAPNTGRRGTVVSTCVHVCTLRLLDNFF